MAKDIVDAIRGCLLAGSIGDALGAATESMNYWEIEERWGRVEDFVALPANDYSQAELGAVTDDTTLKHLMCAAIARKMGRIFPEDLAKIWIEELNLNRVWSPDKISCLKLRAGVSPWDAGRGNIVSGCPSMSIAPIGIINAGNPPQAYQDGFCIASISGEDANREAAAVFAAGVASAFAPDATWETPIRTMEAYSRYTMRKCVDMTMRLARACADVAEFKRRFYETCIDWWSRPTLNWDARHMPNGTGVESVPLAMALIFLCKGDMNRALVEAVNFGRDTDTIANFVGSLLGPIYGCAPLRGHWVERVEKTSRFMFEEYPVEGCGDYAAMARLLARALQCERDGMRARAEELERLLARRG